MATVDLKRCTKDDLSNEEKTRAYLNNMVQQMTYILEHLDEDNFTEKFLSKIKENEDG